jgi:hypothetical protein
MLLNSSKLMLLRCSNSGKALYASNSSVHSSSVCGGRIWAGFQ